MTRRAFITLVGGGAALRILQPVAACAQQSAIPTIGFLNSGSLSGYQNLLIALRKGLAETGYVEGRTVHIEYRWAEGQFERLPALAADLIKRGAARR
jgi:putative tryptophan/tyrosine transport system substrate-binding protein